MKLSVKFGLVILLLLATAVAGSCWLFMRSQRLYREAQQAEARQKEEALLREVKQRASTVASFGEACRDYTQQVLAPAVDKYVPDEMIFEAKSRTFVARGTFEMFRKKEGMQDYSFREASINPLNEKNRADAEEASLVKRFVADRNLKELSGFYRRGDAEVFYVARPIVIERSCLQCHDTPARAPAAIRQRYGDTHGFGWKEGEINSVLMVTVPADDLRQEAARFQKQEEAVQAQQDGALKNLLVPLLVVAAILPILLYGLFEVMVRRRIVAAAAVMKQVAADPAVKTRLPARPSDEIGNMASSFNFMADSLRDSHRTLEERVAERTAALEAEVAERVRTEAALQRAKDAAEAANRAKSAFLATMSHEIRTPLNAVVGMANLLADAPLSPEQRDYARIIRSSGDNLLALINDILDFSKIEAGQLTLDRHPFSPAEVVAEVQEMLSARAGEKGLKLTACVESSVPVNVLGDAARLRQVLVNLIGNAIKFTEHGDVTLHLGTKKPEQRLRGIRPISVAEIPPANLTTLYFSVSDTGPGIPADRLDRLFQVFSQVDSSSARRHGGTGLGLAICKRLCELMGGRIWVESEPGRGSTFYFTVAVGAAPKTEGPAVPTKRREDPTSAFEIDLGQRVPLRILLAEDVPVNQKLMLAILKRIGYQADVAADGRQVIAALHRQPYDVIFMDVQMPEMDGLEATRRIRAEPPPGPRPRIIALTANAMKEDREACLAAGMDDYLSKPVDIGQLQESLRRCGASDLPVLSPQRAPSSNGEMDEAILADLRQLQLNARPHFLRDMVNMFRTDAGRHVAEMQAAVAAGDAARLQTAAHSLKGAAGSLGARGLAQVCLEAEQKGRAECMEDATALIADLQKHYDRACAALEAWADVP